MVKLQDSIQVYQLKISLLGISPSIWRRIHIRSDSNISDLHYTIQLSMGWSDQHLNRFIIYGKEYGVSHIGGTMFQDDPEKITLNLFNFKLRDRFQYEYDFYDSWMHEIRLEKIIEYIPRETYPVCVSGSGGIPPEGCGGVWAFMEIRQNYPEFHLTSRIIELLSGNVEIDIDFINDIKFWMKLYHFDRSAVNQKLNHYAKYGVNPEHWNEELVLCV